MKTMRSDMQMTHDNVQCYPMDSSALSQNPSVHVSPDLLGILVYSPVGGELAHPCGRHDGHARPLLLILICRVDFGLDEGGRRMD